MRPVRRRADERDVELEPVALFEMMNAPVESQQEVQGYDPTPRVISSGDMITRIQARFFRAGSNVVGAHVERIANWSRSRPVA